MDCIVETRQVLADWIWLFHLRLYLSRVTAAAFGRHRWHFATKRKLLATWAHGWLILGSKDWLRYLDGILTIYVLLAPVFVHLRAPDVLLWVNRNSWLLDPFRTLRSLQSTEHLPLAISPSPTPWRHLRPVAFEIDSMQWQVGLVTPSGSSGRPLCRNSLHLFSSLSHVLIPLHHALCVNSSVLAQRVYELPYSVDAT